MFAETISRLSDKMENISKKTPNVFGSTFNISDRILKSET